jgi:hypothetical protein
VLIKTIDCLRGIQVLHDAGLCHGDIRNDHILIEAGSGACRWIDFDLDQGCKAFDVWSVGNILHFVIGGGIIRINDVVRQRPELAGRIRYEDASLFFPYRLQNLRKLFGYLPVCLNSVLVRFAARPRPRYESVDEVVEDLQSCVDLLGWSSEATRSGSAS